MKILVVGDWSWKQYEEAFSDALQLTNNNIFRFPTGKFFSTLLGKFEKKYAFPGLCSLILNYRILKRAYELNPDWIFFWRPTNIWPLTLKRLSSMGILLASYNNDDPFGCYLNSKAPRFHKFMWHWYLKCLPIFDLNFFYRKVNCDEAIVYGSSISHILLPYFQPDQDHPVFLDTEESRLYSTQVVFIGHYESDGRVESIRALLQAGIKVKLWGGKHWSKIVLGSSYEILAPILPVYGENYAKALSGAEICLAFLSKMNRDTYTRRCFEIPACGKLLLAERTEDLINIFKEDEEACFFSSNDELVAKVNWLLQNPGIRRKISDNGCKRVWLDGYDVNSRAREFISILENFKKIKKSLL